MTFHLGSPSIRFGPMIGQSDSVSTALVPQPPLSTGNCHPSPFWHSHKKPPDTLPMVEWKTNAKVNAADDNISSGKGVTLGKILALSRCFGGFDEVNRGQPKVILALPK